MIKKFNHNYLSSDLSPSVNGYYISSWGFSNKKIPNTIKLTLSLKLKKKRILISGKLESTREWDGKISYEVFYFIPNNPHKLQTFFQQQKKA